ncbi:hypothetical protein QOZ80_2AG0143040 [Eleusine coracana subsp. coracana]|nr:hypothetical protein QOZ80_2AG0143040 [Eleusine coracana subsp. coracana]
MDDWWLYDDLDEGHDRLEDREEDQLQDSPHINELGSWDGPLEEKEFEAGEINPPDVAFLSSNLVPYEGARPMNLVATLFICPKCSEPYFASNNYVCNIPTYKCKRCNIKNPTARDWTVTHCYVNGISLNFTKVYDQGPTLLCVLFAFMALCDMMRRVRGARYGCDEGRELDDEEELSAEFPTLVLQKRLIRDTVIDVGEKLSHLLLPIQHCKLPAGSEFVLRILIRSLGSLLPGFLCWPSCELESDLNVYGRVRYIVLLKNLPEHMLLFFMEMVFFRARKSYGEWYHAGIENDGGADFCLWASDLVGDVYGIQLPDYQTMTEVQTVYGNQ